MTKEELRRRAAEKKRAKIKLAKTVVSAALISTIVACLYLLARG